MLEIVYIPQVRIEIPHHGDHGPGSLVPFIAILNGFEMVHHFLYVSAVFRQDQLFPAGIIIVAH
jgi:hypothetical protein